VKITAELEKAEREQARRRDRAAFLAKLPVYDPTWPDNLIERWFDCLERLQVLENASGRGDT